MLRWELPYHLVGGVLVSWSAKTFVALLITQLMQCGIGLGYMNMNILHRYQ